jgi:hypothetical protein
MQTRQALQNGIVIGVLALVAACTPAPVVLSALTVTGQLASWASTSSGTLKAFLAKDQAAVVSGNISSTGGFSLELPVVSGTALTAGLGNLLYGCAAPAVSANPATLQLSKQVTFAVETGGLFAGEVTPRKTNQEVRFIFSNQSSTVSGTEDCLGMTSKGDALYTYNLNLTLGWNAYQILKIADKAYTLSSIALTDVLSWGLKPYQDLAGLTGGVNSSSQGQVKGTLPNLDVNQLLLRISRGVSGDFSNLGDIRTLTNLEFDQTLPVTINSDLLGLFSEFAAPAEGCTNSSSLSNTAAKFGVLNLVLLKNGTATHQSLLRSYAHEVQWWYADQAVNLTGFQTCSGKSGVIQKYSLQLQAGWNAIVVTLEQFGAVQHFQTFAIPDTSRWYPSALLDANTVEPTGLPFVGAVSSWIDAQGSPLPQGIVQAIFRNTNPEFFNRPLRTAPVTNGTFSFNVPSEVSANLSAVALSGVCGQVSASPNTVTGAPLFLDVRVSGQQIAILVAKNGNQRYEWFYADADATVSNTQQCSLGGVQYTEEYNLNLKKGWNVVSYTQLEETASTNRKSITLGSATNPQWTLQYVPLSIGSATGSTNTKLQGQLLNPQTLSKVFKTFVFGEQETDPNIDLSSANIAATGDFSFDLPDTVDPTLFIPLDFADPDCTGTVQYSNPNAAGTPINLGIFETDDTYVATPLPVLVNNATGEKTEFAWWFLDSASNVTGTQNCTDTTTGQIVQIQFNLQLQAGWNIVGAIINNSQSSYSLKSYTTMPANTLWTTEVDEIEVPNAK